MTKDQKEKFEYWLTNNMYINKQTSDLIIRHVETYFVSDSPTPAPPELPLECSKILAEITRLENLALDTYHDLQWSKIVEENPDWTTTEHKMKLELMMTHFQRANKMIPDPFGGPAEMQEPEWKKVIEQIMMAMSGLQKEPVNYFLSNILKHCSQEQMQVLYDKIGRRLPSTTKP